MQVAPPSGGDADERTPVMPKPGDVVAGKYAIVRVLGEGGMGIVYEAMHQRLRQRVALKMLLPAMLQHQVLVSRFEREARAAAQLRGRHVARVNDVDVTADGMPYMVMDFLEGRDLQVEIDTRGRLEVPEAVDYLLQACAAMVEAHQIGIVHRDLKPSNLFLAQEADSSRIVKVLDFGISKITNDESAKLTDVDTMMGTALYMSPEQIMASHAVDARADIWALGVILYETLAGRVPWLGMPPQVAAAIVTTDAPDLRSLCAVPDELAAIVHKTLQRDPNHRFQDVKQLSAALAPFAPMGCVGRTLVEAAFAAGSYPRLPAVPADSVRSVELAPQTREAPQRPAANTEVSGAPDSYVGRTQVSAESPLAASSRTRVLLAALVGVVFLALFSTGVLMILASRRGRSEVHADRATEPSATVAAAVRSAEPPPSAAPRADRPDLDPAPTPPPSAVAPVGGLADRPVVPTPKARPTAIATSQPSTSAKATSPTSPVKPPAPKPTASGNADKPLFL
jgi:serine/threonine-protein kinase